MKKLLSYYLFFFVGLIHSQQNINITNCSSNYTNNMEYNTGEIFVVYTFNNNQYTGKIIDQVSETINFDKSNLIKLYPNPVRSNLFYEIPETIVFECVEVFDSNEKRLNYSTNNKFISLENLPSGTYFIRFNNNPKYNFKILKQ